MTAKLSPERTIFDFGIILSLSKDLLSESCEICLFTCIFFVSRLLLPAGYSHIGTVRVCASENPPCLALTAPKDSTFSTCAAGKDHYFKKVYVSLLFLAPNPLFSRVGQF